MSIWYFSREKLIGIGGLNEDPYTENNKIGRLRRFYISKGLSSYRAREVVIKQTIISCGKEF